MVYNLDSKKKKKKTKINIYSTDKKKRILYSFQEKKPSIKFDTENIKWLFAVVVGEFIIAFFFLSSKVGSFK